jgi:hypothetical protein
VDKGGGLEIRRVLLPTRVRIALRPGFDLKFWVFFFTEKKKEKERRRRRGGPSGGWGWARDRTVRCSPAKRMRGFPSSWFDSSRVRRKSPFPRKKAAGR